ncbi:MAG TPA: hypothetical protein VL242_02985 [Sorangium sp.]|nr:hypothetical protein [Sorangium sp.]
MKQFDTWAHGKIEWIELPPDDPYDYEPDPDDYDPEPQYQLVEHKPLVVPPEKPVDGSVQIRLAACRSCAQRSTSGFRTWSCSSIPSID